MIRVSDKGSQFCAAAMLGSLIVGYLSGCSHSTQSSQVSGYVSLDGKQIGPGTVVFAPVGSGKPATGSVDSSGYYSMTTSRELGLGPGKYKVAVSIREVPASMKRGERPAPGKLLIPERYEDSAKSGLQYDVAPGNNTIEIELKSQSATSASRRFDSPLVRRGFKGVPPENMA